eukprot:9477904-Pyramimonas_sp.AAC.1
MVGLTSGVDPIGDSRSLRFRACTPSSPYPSRMHTTVVGLTSGVDPMCAPAHFFFHLRHVGVMVSRAAPRAAAGRASWGGLCRRRHTTN